MNKDYEINVKNRFWILLIAGSFLLSSCSSEINSREIEESPVQPIEELDEIERDSDIYKIDIEQEISEYRKRFIDLYTSNALGDTESQMNIEEIEIDYDGNNGEPATLIKYTDSYGEVLRYQLNFYGETMRSNINYYLCRDFVWISKECNYYSSWVLTAGYSDVLYSSIENWIIFGDIAYILHDDGELEEIEKIQMGVPLIEEIQQQKAGAAVEAEEKMTAKSRPWERTPVRYAGEYSSTMGIPDAENTIFYQDFHKDYQFACPIGINYFIAVCPQDSLEDYFTRVYASGEPASTRNRKGIYCMFYDDRTCNMGKKELEILFLQNGYELSIYEGECKGYRVRFYQYGTKDSDRWLYPEHIIMQTWDGGNIYVQDITSIMQRKVWNFISIDDRENPFIIVHSSAMTREGIPKEELSFWEFDGNCWSLAPLELEIECFMKNARGKTEPGRIEDFNPIYYKDGIAFETATYVEDEYGFVSYLKLYYMRAVDKNKTFQLSLCEESYDYMNLRPNDGWFNFEIK